MTYKHSQKAWELKRKSDDKTEVPRVVKTSLLYLPITLLVHSTKHRPTKSTISGNTTLAKECQQTQVVEILRQLQLKGNHKHFRQEGINLCIIITAEICNEFKKCVHT